MKPGRKPRNFISGLGKLLQPVVDVDKDLSDVLQTVSGVFFAKAVDLLSAASNISCAVPTPSWTMAVISSAAVPRFRMSALSWTIAQYCLTFAAVGVICSSWEM